MEVKLPDYPTYTVDVKEKTVRNAAGKIVVIKKGTGKYYLTNKAGNRKLVAWDALVASLPTNGTVSSIDIQPGQRVSFKKMKGGQIITGEFVKSHISSRDNKTYAKVLGDDKETYFVQVTKLAKE